MKYLIRNKGKRVAAHIWNGADTECRMWSTGGLVKDKYSLRDDCDGYRICHMCKSNSRKNGKQYTDDQIEEILDMELLANMPRG